MSKQTAVEWLFENMRDIGIQIPQQKTIEMLSLMEQAKEMEKQQIIDAYLAGTLQFDNAASIVYPKTPEHYFNETYKGGDNV